MAEKNRCYLCGGKLRNGYCDACGLDNGRRNRIRYRLNESSVAERFDEGKPEKERVKNRTVTRLSEKDEKKVLKQQKHKEQQYKARKRKAEKHKAQEYKVREYKNQEYKAQEHKEPERKEGERFQISEALNRERAVIQRTISQAGEKDKKIKTAKTTSKVAIVVGIAGIVIGLIQNGVSMWVSYVDEPKTTVVERNYDPYEFEAETLAATGESYQTELRQGTYQVGVHIPEGVYTVNLLEGYGIIDVEDDKNGIYFGRTFGDDEKYDEVHTLEDVRLHQGAVLKVGDSVKLELISENAQPQKMVSFDNPLLEGNTAERIALKKGRFYVAGKDFPAGVYDVSTDKDWGIFKYRIPTENEYVEDGFYDYSEILDVDELGKIYLNIILPEGTEVSTEETDMYLTPSWIIGSEDYRSYYPE